MNLKSLLVSLTRRRRFPVDAGREPELTEQDSTSANDLKALVAHQTAQVSRLADCTTVLAETVLSAEKARRRDRVVYIVLIIVLLMVTIPSTVVVFRISALQHDSKGNAAIIKDCVTPQGECYQRSQASIAGAVARAIDANQNGKLDINEINSELDQILAQIQKNTQALTGKSSKTSK